ncbi:MAG: hypothetical protein IPO83_06150 [Chitinophagaceae bacterium]|nr:hypothetical protein [Chitinophagaceae bacterium]
MRDIEGELKQWELFKSYGEFNLLFENIIQKQRELLIALIRISYNYCDDEDDEVNELEDEDQDRLIKILIQNMGAMEIVESTKSCFIDFFDRQKMKHGDYRYWWNGEMFKVNKFRYEFAIEAFKRCKECILLRNVMIHSNYLLSIIPGFDPVRKLRGSKDVKTAKGYEKRKYEISLDFLIRVNIQIDFLRDIVIWLEKNLYSNDDELTRTMQGKRELSILKKMDFSVPKELS